jgi:hypothetical protein
MKLESREPTDAAEKLKARGSGPTSVKVCPEMPMMRRRAGERVFRGTSLKGWLGGIKARKFEQRGGVLYKLGGM